MSLPGLSPNIQEDFKKAGLYSYVMWFLEKFQLFINNKFHTLGDVTLITFDKGVVFTNADGTHTRAKINATKNGLIFEDLP